MKSSSIFGVATLGMALVLAGPLAAQQVRGGAGDGTGPRVDTSKAFTVQGEVVSFQAAPGQGMGATQRGGRQLCAGGGPDLSRTATFTGAVVSFAGGFGEGFPTLVMSSAQGDVAIVISPYRALMQAGYTPVAGAQVVVKAAPVSLDGHDHWVALAIKDVATGLEVVLRDPATGLPLVMGRGGRR